MDKSKKPLNKSKKDTYERYLEDSMKHGKIVIMKRKRKSN